MKASEARDIFRQTCDSHYTAKGFRFQARSDSYWSKFELGARFIRFRFTTLGTLTLETSAAIRCKPIEDVLHQYIPVPDASIRLARTLWVDSATLLGQTPYSCHFKIRTIEDVEECAKFACKFLYAASDFFSSHADLNSIERCLNTPGTALYSPTPQRAMRAVIAAALVGRPNLAPIIMERRAELADVDRGFHLPDFDRVVDGIRKLPFRER